MITQDMDNLKLEECCFDIKNETEGTSKLIWVEKLYVVTSSYTLIIFN